jgi:hypothetical protein
LLQQLSLILPMRLLMLAANDAANAGCWCCCWTSAATIASLKLLIFFCCCHCCHCWLHIMIELLLCWQLLIMFICSLQVNRRALHIASGACIMVKSEQK